MRPKKRHTASVDLEGNPAKRVKLTPTTNTVSSSQPTKNKKQQRAPRPAPTPTVRNEPPTQPDRPQEDLKQHPNINKLAPPRPFPPVAASASATGPRSAQREGRNYICLTRKTPLGAYMRKCKVLLVNDGYKTLHLHAMGAAIPLLLQLSCALPPILPFPKDEIHTKLSTNTVELQDEVVPDDEEEDVGYRTRGKSTLYIIISIGDGLSEEDGPEQDSRTRPKPSGHSKSQQNKSSENQGPLVYEEPEQELADI